jgi:hypothetical protein
MPAPKLTTSALCRLTKSPATIYTHTGSAHRSAMIHAHRQRALVSHDRTFTMSVPTRGLHARRTGPIGCVAFNQRSTRGRGFLHPGAYCDWVNESPCPNPRGERCPPCCRAMAPDAFRAPLARRRRGPERPFRRSATLVVGRACSPQAAGERQPSLACLSGARGAVLSEATQHHASRSHVQQRTGLSLDRSRGRVSLGGTSVTFLWKESLRPRR